jgi:hypothetical protein
MIDVPNLGSGRRIGIESASAEFLPHGSSSAGGPGRRGGLSGPLPLRKLHAIDRDHDLKHGDERPRTRLCFNASRHDRLSSLHEHDITGLEVRRRVLEEAEVIAGRIVESVDRHRSPSIDRLAVFYDTLVVGYPRWPWPSPRETSYRISYPHHQI